MTDVYSKPKDEGSTSIKPVIRELVRTQYCFPDITLLVDKIIVAKIHSTKDSENTGAYRIYLTDREKSIQAVLRRRLHKHIIRDGLREGSYIVLKDYRLAKSPRLHGTGEIQYIAIYDYYITGQELRSEKSDTESKSSSSSQQRESVESALVGEQKLGESEEREQYETVRSESVDAVNDNGFVNHQVDIGEDATKQAQGREQESSISPPSLPTLAASVSNNLEDVKSIEGNEKKRKGDADTSVGADSGLCSPSTKLRKLGVSEIDPIGQGTTSALRQTDSPWARKAEAAGAPLQPIERPLRLSTLASVTGINRSRNKVVDVLALVDSVDESAVKPARLPLKRDIRIIDSSTDRKVTVSIFVDPDDCVPQAGAVVLFRNLVTHDWKQGALNAYPKYCAGKDWYIPDPERVDGRGLELKDLKAKILASEQERRMPANAGDEKSTERNPEKGQER